MNISYGTTHLIINLVWLFLLAFTSFYDGGIIIYSTDGHRVATTENKNNIVHIWDAEMGKLSIPLQGHRRRINAMAFSPCDRWITVDSDDRTVKQWDARSGQQKVMSSTIIQIGLQTFSFSPNGNHIISGCYDGSVRIWDLESDKISPSASSSRCFPQDRGL